MRTKKTVSLPRELIDFVEKMVKERKVYNFSHAVEIALMEWRERKQKKETP